ncbi:Exostosin family protein [Quillaja saponaria]|uniref:Exostosin family protein n=1 Tax=Quillaja saponaria TaxID=32244 RepID=A0AAD7LX40_QUISA|nr:Exostosin family protein [Quillaja saponaria]
MGQKLFSALQTETKRLPWLIGMTFAVILVFQHFELRYSNVFSSLFTANNIPSQQIRDPPSESGIISNKTLLNESSSSGGYDIHEIVNEDTRTSEGKNTKSKQDLVSEIGRDSHKPLEIDDRDTDSTVDSIDNTDHESAPEPGGELEWSSYRTNDTTDRSHLSFTSEHRNGNLPANFSSPSPAIPPLFPSSPLTSPTKVDPNITIPVLSSDSNIAASEKDLKSSPNKNKTSRPLQSDYPMSNNSSTRSPPKKPKVAVTSISEMNKLLIQNHGFLHSMIPRWPSEADQELLDARSQIENAPTMKNDPSLYAPLYRNVSEFKRSYELMEDTLQVYIYREGKKPILHQPILKGIYASEGWFMSLLESNKKFVTKDPNKAHLFYLPFSSRMLKYPFWNRAGGADHFLVACHDWAPAETREHMAQSIRALCNSDVKEGFVFGKDVSLPETNIPLAQNPAKDLGGKPPSQRSTLAFFAGSMHGYLRPILLQHWKDKDPDIKVFGKMPKSKGNRNYIQHMKSSKYCICAKGNEVSSPRVVEAIFYECVPVIISDNFVPPFFEILNWESFAVFVLEKDIPNLKTILQSIPQKRYLQMQMRVKKVQKHFVWHAKPVKYDIFHMILHSVWYNRVFNARVA